MDHHTVAMTRRCGSARLANFPSYSNCNLRGVCPPFVCSALPHNGCARLALLHPLVLQHSALPSDMLHCISKPPAHHQVCAHRSVLVCSLLASRLGLVEGKDWVRVCIGGAAFYRGLDDMSEYANYQTYGSDQRWRGKGGYSPAKYCDFFAAGLSAYSDRVDRMGLQITRPIFRSSVAGMVHAPVQVCLLRIMRKCRSDVFACSGVLIWLLWPLLFGTA